MPCEAHSVTWHPVELTFPPLTQLKLVLDLETLEGCKAELIWEHGRYFVKSNSRVHGP